MELWDKEKKESKKQKLDTVTVWELMNNSFYIPDYQRGYRWTAFEVRKLLEDLRDYIQEYKKGDSFYCMQPLVVFYNAEKEAWEVIDGQQRLTTLYLILSQKRSRLIEDNPEMKFFDLTYQSRPDSQAFLKQIDFSRKRTTLITIIFVMQLQKYNPILKVLIPEDL